eukprot:1195844-Prorocentrum_minimum.AAC.2
MIIFLTCVGEGVEADVHEVVLSEVVAGGQVQREEVDAGRLQTLRHQRRAEVVRLRNITAPLTSATHKPADPPSRDT